MLILTYKSIFDLCVTLNVRKGDSVYIFFA